MTMCRRGNLLLTSIAMMAVAAPVFGQTISSTSTGSDGALNLTTPGIVVFNPQSFNPVLNPSGNNIYNFTTINIAAGVTVQLSGQILNGPVYWLAQGAVTINGTISLDGGDGYSCVSPPNPAIRVPSVPGPGGYAGGVGGMVTDTFSDNYQPGSGPGGGIGGGLAGSAASTGKFTGNVFLVPLIGGSGGTGGTTDGANSACGGGGGAGGGAILIASSTSIAINGSITSNGGNGGNPGSNISNGGGSGGAIRLVAPLIQGTGSMSAGPVGTTFQGIIRLEAFQQNFTGTISPGAVSLAAPLSVALPSGGPPVVSVVSVAGVAIPASPTGSFQIPDGTINQSTPAAVVIQASNIPVGTVPTLYIFSESGPDMTVQAPALTGTLASSTATVSVTFPPGFSRGYVRAAWTP